MPSELHTETSGSGPTVLFVHGLDSTAAVWRPVIDLLADHPCVAVDLPGHGRSPTSTDPDDYSRESVLHDLDEIMGSLDGPVVLVGHSLGGYLGMAYALTRPKALTGLVLVSTGPRREETLVRGNLPLARRLAEVIRSEHTTTSA